MTFPITGGMSTFGGPDDTGVAPDEGLALIEPIDLGLWWYACLFLPSQPVETSGLARRLNPKAFYLAMRWDYAQYSRSTLRNAVVRLSAKSLHVFARPVDWGPNIDTGRIADLSPAAAAALGLKTDDVVTAELVI